MKNKPTFKTWSKESVDTFAEESFDSMCGLMKANATLRLQLADQRAGYLARIKVLLEDRDRLLEQSRNH